MTTSIKLLNQFLGQIFTENCRCFVSTCSVKTSDNLVNKILYILKEYQNPKACKTFFESSRIDYRSVFNKHLRTMIRLKLIKPNYNSLYTLANGSEFLWKNIMLSHQEENCFCLPVQKMRKDLINLVKISCDAETCAQIVELQDYQLHILTQCIFWYFRKAMVDNLLQYCYYVAEPDRAQEMFIAPNIQPTRSLDYIPFHNSQGGGIDDLKTIFSSLSKKNKVNPEMRSLPNLNIKKQIPVSIDMYMDDDISIDFNVGIPEPHKLNYDSCYAVSVGSLNVTSDYDVTLYGTCVTSVIQHFYEIFENVFHRTSNDVFDTNLYGSSFIEFFSDVPNPDLVPSYKFYAVVNCSPTPFHDEIYHYVVSPSKAENLQLINKKCSIVAKVQQRLFALLKLSKSLKTVLSEVNHNNNINEELYKYLKYLQLLTAVEKMEITFTKSNLTESEKLCPSSSDSLAVFFYRIGKYVTKYLASDYPTISSPISRGYENLPFNIIRHRSNYNSLLNYISIYNFFGNETYYTRGAFMHVVLKMQTCSSATKSEEFTDLSSECLMDSFIENLSDFIVHEGKRKYVTRMESALNQLTITSPLKNSILHSLQLVPLQSDPNNRDEHILKTFIIVESLQFVFESLKNFLTENISSEHISHVVFLALKDILKFFADIENKMNS